MVYLNGINGATGEYLAPPLTIAQAAQWIKREPHDAAAVRWLKHVWRQVSQLHWGLPVGIEPADVRQAGWAIVFCDDEHDAVKKALTPLIEHRSRQIADDSKVKVLTYHHAETRSEWLGRHGTAAGSVEPRKVPYYLLLVGSPARMPFSFGHLLGVEYAVGRLHFNNSDHYSSYVESLLAYESDEAVPNAKEAVYFAPGHRSDAATQQSSDLLAAPLAFGRPEMEEKHGVARRLGYRTHAIFKEGATKAALRSVLSMRDAAPPAFVFTASHGIGWPSGHPNQRAAQGALLCQDWPGSGTVGPAHYLAATDISPDFNLHGMMTFHFACYSAGTPSHDRFTLVPGQPPSQIADEPFIASLPQAMLSHARGGALACVGHVERAWAYSFVSPHAGTHLLTFQNAIARILSGQPVGYAVKDFKERYAALSAELVDDLVQLGFDPTAVPDEKLVATWIERNDAESYIVLGDPAVRLRVDKL